jgi:hypothetical protein
MLGRPQQMFHAVFNSVGKIGVAAIPLTVRPLMPDAELSTTGALSLTSNDDQRRMTQWLQAASDGGRSAHGNADKQ